MRTTFFTAADELYEPFVLPFIAGACATNDDARAEVCLRDPAAFAASNGEALAILRKHFGDRFLLRGGDFSRKPQTVRFFEVPRVNTPFTFITDIDILYTRPVSEWCIARMRDLGLPYFNRKRHDFRLTGLHFTRTDAYYPLPDIDIARYDTDESMLYKLVAARGHAIAPETVARPIFGIHMSLQQRPVAPQNRPQPNWEVAESRARQYIRLRDSDVWREILPWFDMKYRVALLVLETAIMCACPHIEIEPHEGTRLCDVFREL